MVLMILQSIRFIPEIVINILTMVSYVWGLALIVLVLIKEKPYDPKKRYFPLFCILGAFFLGYGITIAVNSSMNFFSNIKGFVSTGIQLFLLFFCLASIETLDADKLFRLLMKTLIAVTFLVAIANIYIYIARIEDESAAGRVQGIFANPNNASVCALSLVSCFWLLRFEKGRRWHYIVNIVLQLITVIISNSRASVIFLAVVFSLFACIYAFEKINKKTGLSILLALGLIAGGFACFKTVELVTTYLPSMGDLSKELITDLTAPKKENSSQGRVKVAPEDISRNGVAEENSSTVRINLIISGWISFTKHPVFGVSPRNVAQIVVEENPTRNLHGIEGGGLHNAYIQLLMANGFIGFLLLILLIGYCIKLIVPGWKREVQYGTAILAGLLTYGMFEYSLIFANSSTSVFFWSLLGYTVFMAAKNYKQKIGLPQIDNAEQEKSETPEN